MNWQDLISCDYVYGLHNVFLLLWLHSKFLYDNKQNMCPSF